MKRIILAIATLLVSIATFSGQIIKNVDAEPLPIQLINAEVQDASGTASESNFNFSDGKISDDIVFHTTGDSIAYNVTFRNESDDDYRLENVSLQGANDSIGVDYSNDIISGNSESSLLIELVYNQAIDDISQREFSGSLSLVFDFAKITPAAAPETLETEAENPVTLDSIVRHWGLLAASFCGIVLSVACLVRRKKSKLLILPALALALVIPSTASATSPSNVLALELNVDFASFVEISYGEQEGIGEMIVVPYGQKLDLPTPEKTCATFVGWADSNGEIVEFARQDEELIAVFEDDEVCLEALMAAYNQARVTKEIESYEYWAGIYNSTRWQNNPGAFGNCTWFAWWWRRNNMPEEYWLPAGTLGNAYSWPSSLAARGFKLGTTPKYGAVVLTSAEGYGHVAVVVGVTKGEYITVQSMNYAGPNGSLNHVYQWTIDWDKATDLTYIYEREQEEGF